ncbi:YihY/virulence factor BrkB family protein [Actinacidiphila sp. bgisy167]|uniref:YihY/virulence factor BrkB family protein n=1 Tax=Actinacidiphila sp. bgisy167 TaxID=3413797 RepID=UPI003D7192BE
MARRPRAGARKPTQLPQESWRAVLRRTVKEFWADHLTDWAAALTYYAVLSVFPALLVMASAVSLLGGPGVEGLIANTSGLAPGPVRETLTGVLGQLRRGVGRNGLALAVGVVVAVWSSSNYVATFMRAANALYDVDEGRPLWKTLAGRFVIPVVLLVVTTLIAIGVVFTGALARKAGQVLGVGDAALGVWGVVKWPVMLVLFGLVLALLYGAAPNVRHGGFRWVSPGSCLAVVIWAAASALFSLYVSGIADYTRLYGSLGAVIVFLVWLWISNIAVLLGLEFNAELERARARPYGGLDDGPDVKVPKAAPQDTERLHTDEG